MASLKTGLSLGLVGALVAGCGQVTTTQVLNLDTDTYLSSSDSANHSELPYVELARTGTTEERGLIKLPTGDHDTEKNVDALLSNPLAITVAPYLVLIEVIARILDCDTNVIQPQNLTSSKLVFNVQSSDGGTLAGKVRLLLLSKPWFQTANWQRAHFFSAKGWWATPGGDTDASFTPIASTYDAGAGTLEFDITTYFRSLISAQGEAVHYGMLLVPDAGGLSPVQLSSTQALDTSRRPRVVSTYTGYCGSSSAQALSPHKVFVLGRR